MSDRGQLIPASKATLEKPPDNEQNLDYTDQPSQLGRDEAQIRPRYIQEPQVRTNERLVRMSLDYPASQFVPESPEPGTDLQYSKPGPSSVQRPRTGSGPSSEWVGAWELGSSKCS